MFEIFEILHDKGFVENVCFAGSLRVIMIVECVSQRRRLALKRECKTVWR